MLLIIQQLFKNEANLYSDRKRFSKDTVMGRYITWMLSVYKSIMKKKKALQTQPQKEKEHFTYICWYTHKIFLKIR